MAMLMRPLAIDTDRRHTFAGRDPEEPTTPTMDLACVAAPRAVFARAQKPTKSSRKGRMRIKAVCRVPAGGAVDALRWNQLRWALTLSPYGSFDLYDSTFDEMPSACVVTAAEAPFRVLNTNQAWLDLCHFAAKREIVGRTLRCIQGPQTDAAAVARVCAATEGGRPAEAALVNYKGDGEAFLNYLRISPLFADDDDDAVFPSMYLGVLEDHCAPKVNGFARSPATTPASSAYATSESGSSDTAADF